MSKIEFEQGDKQILLDKLQRYFTTELDYELGQFDGEFLLEFISKEMGAFYYNQGLYDAQAVFESKVEALSEVVMELEMNTNMQGHS